MADVTIKNEMRIIVTIRDSIALSSKTKKPLARMPRAFLVAE